MIKKSLSRDLRIDFFRGISLFMILVDHTQDSPLSRLTFRVFGFADAAEVFVYLSGFVGGIVYSRHLQRGGWPGLARVLGARTLRIYIYYFLTSIALVVIPVVANSWGLPGTLYVRTPTEGFAATLHLIFPSSIAGILLLYVIFTAVVIPLFFLGSHFSVGVTVAVSAAIWAAVQIFPNFAPNTDALVLFNPYAWQFLFVIGLALGSTPRSPRETAILDSKWLVVVAWLIVIAAFGYRAVFYAGKAGLLNADWLMDVVEVSTRSKANLSPARVLHFFSVALLVSTYVRRDHPFFKSSWAQPAILASRVSLLVYCLSCVVALLGSYYVATAHPSLPVRVLLDLVLIVILGALAVARNKIKQVAA